MQILCIRRYELVEDYGRFAVDSVTGEIMSTTTLDRELVAEYELLVRASDHGLPPLTSIVSVHVTVNDINDNLPMFQKFGFADL